MGCCFFYFLTVTFAKPARPKVKITQIKNAKALEHETTNLQSNDHLPSAYGQPVYYGMHTDR